MQMFFETGHRQVNEIVIRLWVRTAFSLVLEKALLHRGYLIPLKSVRCASGVVELCNNQRWSDEVVGQKDQRMGGLLEFGGKRFWRMAAG